MAVIYADLTNAGKEACKSTTGLLKVLKENSDCSIMKQYYHYKTVNCKENKMNLHRSGWVGYVLKQQSAITKSMIDDSKSNLLMA